MTLAELIALRDEIKDAYSKSLRAVSYNISTRGLVREKPSELLKQLRYLEREITLRRAGASGGAIQATFPDDYEASTT